MQYGYNELAGGQPVFLLDVEFASRTFRFSTYPLTLNDAAGDPIAYTGGLQDVELEETTNMVGVDIEANTASISVVFDGVDLLKLWRAGHVLEGAPATLSYVILKNGTIAQNMATRLILLSGAIQNPEFGDPLEPLGYCAFSVEQRPFDSPTGGALISSSQIIDAVRFPKADEETATGKTYPLIIAGNDQELINGAGANIGMFTTPAYCIQKHAPTDHCLFLIAGHAVKANLVTIIGPRDETATLAVLTSVDATGNVYSYIDVDGTAIFEPGKTYLTGDIPSTKEWWIRWDNTDGGLQNPFADGALSGGGDICLWALLTGGYSVDRGSWDALRPVLNKYQFHGYINDTGLSAWEWLQDHIVPFLPIEIKNGNNGLRAVLAQLYARSHRPLAVANIYIGSDFCITSAITTETDTNDIVNDVTLLYARDGKADKLTFSSRQGAGLAADGLINADNQFAVLSQSRYGKKSNTIECEFVYDRGTAFLIAGDLLRQKALPKRTFAVAADVKWGFLETGDIVLLTSVALYFSNTLAVIGSKKWQDGAWRITLIIEDSPLNTERQF